MVIGITPTPTLPAPHSLTHVTPSADTIKEPSCDSIDPEVYNTRRERYLERTGHPEKYSGFTRAYWSIACTHCHKEVRFCCMCQGELWPVEKEKKDGIHRLQCTECHRVVTMRYCSACGHQFEDTVVDARMEIPGVNVGDGEASEAQTATQKLTGELYRQAHFSGMTKVSARLHNHFLYLFNTPAAAVPSMAFFLEKATVQMWRRGEASM